MYLSGELNNCDHKLCVKEQLNNDRDIVFECIIRWGAILLCKKCIDGLIKPKSVRHFKGAKTISIAKHEKQYKKLKARDRKIFKAINGLYNESRSCTKINDTYTEYFDVKSGVK